MSIIEDVIIDFNLVINKCKGAKLTENVIFHDYGQISVCNRDSEIYILGDFRSEINYYI